MKKDLLLEQSRKVGRLLKERKALAASITTQPRELKRLIKKLDKIINSETGAAIVALGEEIAGIELVLRKKFGTLFLDPEKTKAAGDDIYVERDMLVDNLRLLSTAACALGPVGSILQHVQIKLGDRLSQLQHEEQDEKATEARDIAGH